MIIIIDNSMLTSEFRSNTSVEIFTRSCEVVSLLSTAILGYLQGDIFDTTVHREILCYRGELS